MSESKQILFVDDEPGIRATLPAVLRRRGFTVAVVATVAEAVEEINKQRFELLLTDLNIESEADGFEVVRAMREAHPACVNIILTGYPGVDTAIEGIREKIDEYILKPTDTDKLIALVVGKLAERKPKACEYSRFPTTSR